MLAKSGHVLEHPITQEKIVIRQSASDTEGALLQGDFYVQPGGFLAAEHIHPLQEERFEVISGTLGVRLVSKEFTIGPGEVVVVPAGTPHLWWNAGDTEMHALVDVRPALRTENFFEAFFGLAQDGRANPKTGLPNLLWMAVLMREYRNELILARPPRLMQTVLFSLLAPIGRLLGYRGDYPYPHLRQAQIQPQIS